MKTQLPWLIIFFALFGIILYLVEFKPLPEPEIIHTKTYTIDSIEIHDTIYVPKYFYSEVQKYDTVTNTDTIYIVKDYNTKYYYSDTIRNDANAFIIVNDIIYQNRIFARKNDIKLYSHTIHKTESIIQPKKWHLIAVGGVSGNKHNFGFDMGLGIRTRKGTDISLGYDPVNSYWRVGISVIVK